MSYDNRGNSGNNSNFSDVYSDPNLNQGNQGNNTNYDYNKLVETFGNDSGRNTHGTAPTKHGSQRSPRTSSNTRVASSSRQTRKPSSQRGSQGGRTNHGARPSSQNASQRRPTRRRRRKPNIIPVIIMGVVGVVIIALLIVGLQALFSFIGGSGGTATPEATPDPSTVSENADNEPVTTPIPQAATESNVDGLDPVVYEHMYIVGDASFDIYKFRQDIADSYVSAINNAVEEIPEDVNIYQMVIPNAMDIMLPLSFLEYYADVTSDQEKSIQYLYSGTDERVTNIEIYRILKAHCDEYLYFKTDSKWTSLAAYYAYNEWCYVKDFNVSSLSAYSRTQVDGYLGYNYHFTEHSAISEEETIDIYVPSAQMTFETGTTVADLAEAEMFPDVEDSESRSKHNAILGGVSDISKITNASSAGDDVCILVGDSSITTFAPFIAQNYSETYIIDYRYYSGGTLAELVAEVGANDVLFATGIMASTTTAMVQGLNTLS